MNVTKVISHYGNFIVTANVDGNYDKRGLPDPLVLAFYFTCPYQKSYPDGQRPSSRMGLWLDGPVARPRRDVRTHGRQVLAIAFRTAGQ